ncbi:MAG: glycosyltransferase family 4 protein [bacterium]|nr:glycosyltransferase family 4 protein [bacterium]
MRVAVVLDTWFPFIGGGQINAYEISKRLAKGDIHVDIITRNNGRENLQLPRNLKVVKLGKSKIVFEARAFLYLIRSNYDIIHAHAFFPGITARLVSVFTKTPTIFTVHGTSINTKLNNIFSRSIEKFILTQILYNREITVSQDFLKFKNINKKVVYIANGVDCDKFERIRAKQTKKPTVLFVGRLHPQKNLINIIKAVNIAKEKIDLEFVIVGTGPQKSQIKQLIKDLKLQNTITMLGAVTGSDLISIYKSCDVLILCSVYEGQPLTLLEAWAARKPVIAARTGDCQYLIKDGKNGYLINDPLNINEIARVIVKALRNKSLSSLGQNGYNLVRKNFSWEKSAQQTKNVYESLTKSQN